MATTILEVSSSNADIVTNNSLTTIFNPPIDVPTPSVLNFQQGFLDLRALGNSGTDSFVLDENVEIGIEMAFYECYLGEFNTKDVNKYNVRKKLLDGNDVDTDDESKHSLGRMHVMYVVEYPEGQEPTEVLVNKDTIISNFNLITETLNFEVERGIYTADTLVKYINDRLQNATYDLKSKYGADFFDYGITNNIMYSPFKFFVDKYTKIVPDSDPVRYKSAVVFLKVENDPISFNYKTEYSSGKDINIGYTYPQMKPPDTDTGSDRTTADLMIGCPVASLENNDGVISFDYLHNPVYQIDKETGDRNEFVQIQTNFAETDRIQNYFIFSRGGVNLVSLSPSTFWNDLLGFDISEIALKISREPAIELTNGPSDFINATGINSFDSSTTRPFFGTSTVDSYINYDTEKGEILTTEYDIQQQNSIDKADAFRALDVVDTVSINAVSPINFAQFNTGGHFLITIDIGYYVNNFNGAKLKKNITCVASREYLTNGFLSILSGGAPIILQAGSVISYIQLTIIDPITKQPATDIGMNNSFYLTMSS
jgi:hypothetical protein